MTERPMTTAYWQGMTRQERILDAMAEANPDEDGSLIRELHKRGVLPVTKPQEREPYRNRRSRFVQGWRP